MEGSVRCDANYVPLTPLSFLERAALVYGARTAVVFGDRAYSRRDTRSRCLAGASALARLGVGRRDVVAVLVANTPVMFELHFGVPMTGGVLCTLNTRHDRVYICAFITLKDGANATEAEIIGFCRQRLPRYMAPRTVVFADLPKTSTGKTQKYLLRETARAMGSLPKQGTSKP